MNIFGKNLALWIIIALLLVALFNLFQNSSGRGALETLDFSEFMTRVERGEINSVTIQGKKITGQFSDGSGFDTYAPDDPTMVATLKQRGVGIKAIPPDDGMPTLLGILVNWFPMLLLIGRASCRERV